MILLLGILILYLATSARCFSTCSEDDFIGRACASECEPGTYNNQYCHCQACPAPAGSDPFERKRYLCLVGQFKMCPEMAHKIPAIPPAAPALLDNPSRISANIDSSAAELLGRKPSSANASFGFTPDSSDSTVVSTRAVNDSSPKNSSVTEQDTSDNYFAAKLGVGLVASFVLLCLIIGLTLWRCGGRHDRPRKREALLGCDHDGGPNLTNNVQYPIDF